MKLHSLTRKLADRFGQGASSLSPIGVLLSRSGPTAIAWCIRAVIVRIPIQRVSWRPWSHVTQEDAEVFTPFIAHHDAASAVIRIMRHVRILTASLRGCPRNIRTCLTCAMCQRSRRNGFSSQTAATVGPAIAQRFSVDRAYLPAIATAIPVGSGARWSIWCSLFNCPATEALPS